MPRNRITYRATRKRRGMLATWWKFENGEPVDWYGIQSPGCREIRAGKAAVFAVGNGIRIPRHRVRPAELRRLARLPLSQRTAAVEQLLTEET